MGVDENEPTVARIAVVGAGSIGKAFAVVFADAGFAVRLCETDAAVRDAAMADIRDAISELQRFELCATDTEAIVARISLHAELDEAVADAGYVQECVPEDLQLKQSVFRALESLAAESAILASSSSAMPASQIAAGLDTASRCLVAHPGNPPSLLRVVEVVPAACTEPRCVERACAILRAAGLRPVVLRKEVPGFVFNRIQGAVLREAYCLVRDGVAGVEDIDVIVRDGLGLRWAVVGPFETADLNRRGGIAAHAAIMGAAYESMGAERGQRDPWTPELVAGVAAERRALLALENWDERVRWRDRQIMKLLGRRRE